VQDVLLNDRDFLKRVIESFCQKLRDPRLYRRGAFSIQTLLALQFLQGIALIPTFTGGKFPLN